MDVAVPSASHCFLIPIGGGSIGLQARRVISEGEGLCSRAAVATIA